MYSLAEDHIEDLAMNLVFADPGRSGGDRLEDSQLWLHPDKRPYISCE